MTADAKPVSFTIEGIPSATELGRCGDDRNGTLTRVSDGELPIWDLPEGWSIVGIGDFNGDGISDLLWRSDTGELSDWLGTAAGQFTNNDANAAAWAPHNWSVVGPGDFSGAGRDGILWRSDTGALSDWLGNQVGGFVNNDVNAATGAPTDWSIAGIGDFNGDGRSDILWRNSVSGALSDCGC